MELSLLIADTDNHLVARCKQWCSLKRIELRSADSGVACLEMVRQSPPDLLALAFELPLTAAGEWTGTANYMAPECFRSTCAASPRSDLYSLGITFYEVSTGERPLISWPVPSALNASLPPPFDRVIMKLLAKDPADRFTSASEAVSALA